MQSKHSNNQKETRMEANVSQIDTNSHIGIPAPKQELTISA